MSLSTHKRTILHQVDLQSNPRGGIDTCIRDLVWHGSTPLDVLGISSRSDTPLFEWVQVADRPSVRFMAVAGPPTRREAWVPDTVRLLIGALRARKHLAEAELLQAHRVEVGAALGLLLRSTPLVQFIHGDGLSGLTHDSDSHWRRFPWLYRLCERRVVTSATDVVIFSRSGADRLAPLAPSRVRFSPTWYSPSLFYPAKREPGSNTVAWVGRLEPPKDPVLAIEAAAYLARHNPGFRIRIVGDGSLYGDVRDRVREYGLAKNVELLGFLSPGEVADVVRDSEVLLATSHFEGVSRAMIEAQACGTPVACVRAADPSATVRHGVSGIVVDSRDPAALGEAVLAARGLTRDGCAQHAQQFSADAVISQLLGAGCD